MNVGELVTALNNASQPADRLALVAGQSTEVLRAVVTSLKKRSDDSSLNDLPAAFRLVELAEEVAGAAQDETCWAFAHWARGNLLIQAGLFPACLEAYLQAEQFFEGISSEIEVGRLATNRAFALKNMGRYEEGLAAAQKALDLLRSQPATIYLASSLNATGSLLRLLRRFSEALAALSECEAIYAALGDPVRLARAMINRANLLENIDRFSEAVALLEQARETLVSQETWLEVARADLNLGILSSRLGRFDAALRAFQQSEERFLGQQNGMEAAVVRLYRADLYAEFNLYDDLLQDADKDQSIFAEGQMPWQAGRAHLHRAVAYRKRGDWEKARKMAASAQTIFNHLPDPLWSHLAGFEQAQSLAASAEWKDALKAGLAMLEFLHSQGTPVRAGQAMLFCGRCCLALDDLEQASSHFQKALVIATESGSALLLFSALFGLGQLARKVQDWDAAYKQYHSAVELIEDLRRSLTVEDFRTGFLDDKLEFYQAMVQTCMNLGRMEEAFSYVERAKSGVLVDQLIAALSQAAQSPTGDPALLARLKELGQKLNRRYNQLDGYDETRRQPGAYSESELWREMTALEHETTQVWRQFQESHPFFKGLVNPTPTVLPFLKEGEVLLQYFITGQDIQAFAVGPSGLTGHQMLPGCVGRIQQALYALENLMKGAAATSGIGCAGGPEALIRQVLGRLYADMFQPLEKWLKEGDKLRIAPDGFLFDIPFHALYCDGTYLVDRYEVTTIPCAGVLNLCRQSTQGHSAHRPLAMIVGCTDNGRLRHVAGEVAAVSGYLPGARVCVDEPDAQVVLQKLSDGCQIFHVASHADFRRDNPIFSAIQLSGHNWLRALDIYNLRLSGSLVTLSACQSGRHSLLGGDLQGLGHAFFYAGAAAQIGALWLADDAASAVLMQKFYFYLTHGEFAATALRQAQLDLRSYSDAQGRQCYTNPYFWAPFYLMGDPNFQLTGN